MKAAVIDSLERGPRFAYSDEPLVAGEDTLVQVTTAGLHPFVRMLASGEHYASHGVLPMIPGIDGTGHTADGTRVYLRWCPRAVRADGPAGRGSVRAAVA